MDRNGNFFDDIEERTNVKKEDLFHIADSAKNADFTNEETVRELIAQVSQLAGVPVSEEKADRLVKAITANEFPTDFSTLARMFNQSK